MTRSPDQEDSMTKPFVDYAGRVHAEGHVFAPSPEVCSHDGRNVCPTCDFDGYCAAYHPDACPWSETNRVTR